MPRNGFYRSYQCMSVQCGSHTECTERKDLELKMADETSERAELSEIEMGTGYYSGINLRFLIFSRLIFESSVVRGIPSFAAAPCGPATFPLLSAKAASIISFS